MLAADMNAVQRTQHSENLQKPYHNSNHDNYIQDVFDLCIHRYVGVDEPKQHANHNQDDNQINEGHKNLLFDHEVPGEMIHAAYAA
jgi:hypothetical protein